MPYPLTSASKAARVPRKLERAKGRIISPGKPTVRPGKMTQGNSAGSVALPSLKPRQEVCAPKSDERRRIRVARNETANGVSQVFNEYIALTGIRISA